MPPQHPPGRERPPARERVITGSMNVALPSALPQNERLISQSNERVRVGNDIPISRDCTMGVSATGTVTQEGIEKFIAYLNLIKDAFPTQRDVEAQPEIDERQQQEKAAMIPAD